ncbi:MAG: flagellar assembly peptidoglycan hydrolase FlgJ [Steroidobacteraceae bacterium]|jgi:flagellar protein FlgJ|nr:flagellar assembly peptidoglycan hydrolase FlgJ [Steroidobacteraceae bacterium]
MAIDPARATTYTDLQSLTALKREARTQEPGALRETARQFESVFTRMLLQSMRQASQGDALFDSQQSGFYRDMFDDQLAIELSRGRGLGLAEMMVEQLMRSGATAPGPGAAAAGAADTAAATSGPGRWPGSAAAQAPAAASAATATDPGGGTTSADREAFVREMLPHAEAAGRRLGVAPRTLIAHAALETGWGRSMPRGPEGASSFNLFGIKAGGGWQGASVAAATTEFEGGVAGTRIERFRAYGSPSASFGDYAGLLQGSGRYAAALGTGDDAARFGRALQQGGYATDPDYARKLAAVAAGVGEILDGGLKAGNGLPIQPPDRSS